MIEIGNLAVYLRHAEALDTEGIVAAQMAEDLADTRQDVMVQAFRLARREATWLPKTSEMLGFYARALKTRLDEDEADRKAAADEEDRKLREDRRLHPENYVGIDDIIKDTAAKLGMEKPRKTLQEMRETPGRAITVGDPQMSECPHCGKPIAQTAADMRGYSPADLRSIADHREQQLVEKRARCVATWGEARALELYGPAPTPPAPPAPAPEAPVPAKPRRTRKSKETA